MSEQENDLPDECCAKCRFSVLCAIPQDLPPVLTCKRYPPTYHRLDDDDDDEDDPWHQPLVYGHDWCGEFQPRQPGKPA